MSFHVGARGFIFEEVELRGQGVHHVAFHLLPPLRVGCHVDLELYPRVLGRRLVGGLHAWFFTMLSQLARQIG